MDGMHNVATEKEVTLPLIKALIVHLTMHDTTVRSRASMAFVMFNECVHVKDTSVHS